MNEMELQRVLYNIVTNATLREEVLRYYRNDGERDLYASCKWPTQINPKDYMEMYERNPIAGRIVDLMPNECWSEPPLVFEGEKPSSSSEFEKAWRDLPKQLVSDDVNYHVDDVQNPIYEVLHRLDKCCGIGSYGVLLLGVNDDNARNLSLPISGYQEEGSMPSNDRWQKVGNSNQPHIYKFVTNTKKPLKLSYLIPLPQVYAEVSSWESNVYSPRYGKPITYLISLKGASQELVNMPSSSVVVHWTRVIHVADNNFLDNLFGIPRLKPIYNNLLDINKILGGSAEMYWQGALPGIILETHPQLGGDVEIDKQAMNREAQQFVQTLSRWMILRGMTARTLSPIVVDPRGQLEVQYEAIATRLDIPKRRLIGSERGELASSQDERQWRKRIKGRNTTWTIPNIVCKFINRLIAIGVLPKPKVGYKVDWSEELGMTEKEQLEVSAMKANVMSTYVSASLENILPLEVFFEELLKFTPEKIKSIIKQLKESQVVTKKGLEDEINQKD